MNEAIYALWFSQLESLGIRNAYHIYKEFPDFESIFNSSWKDIELVFKETRKTGCKINYDRFEKHKESLPSCEAFYEKLTGLDVKVLHPNHKNFPVLLKDLADCPLVLFAKGNVDFPNFGIGIVGARRCSVYGKKVAIHMAAELAKAGVNIVSGLAYGIDVASHQGALQGNGFTTAVLGGGIHECYPPGHRDIFNRIQEKGCVLSEETYGRATEPYMFPKRNRLISGMSHGLLVVEAAEKSGSLITVDFALEQGKEVFTIPNRLFEPSAVGTNNLIKQGAKLVFHIDDILSEFAYISLENNKMSEKKEKSLEENEKIVYSCISYDPIHEESIIEQVFDTVKMCLETMGRCNLADNYPKEVLLRLDYNGIVMAMISLELKGFIKKISGCYYARSEV